MTAALRSSPQEKRRAERAEQQRIRTEREKERQTRLAVSGRWPPSAGPRVAVPALTAEETEMPRVPKETPHPSAARPREPSSASPSCTAVGGPPRQGLLAWRGAGPRELEPMCSAPLLPPGTASARRVPGAPSVLAQTQGVWPPA